MGSLRQLLLPGLALLVVACAPEPPWHGTKVAGVLPDLEFELTGPGGVTVTPADFRGSLTLLFFGFTHCPGPCPSTLKRIGVALEDLGEQGGEVRVLLVTVDPERDNPDVLARYAESFGPWLLGLTGSPEQLDSIMQDYKVHAQKLLGGDGGGYDVAHSTAVFAFDRLGRARLLYSGAFEPAQLAADLARL